jgi:hypothetical protein
MCWLSTSYERKTLPHLAILLPRPLFGPERVHSDPFSMCWRYQDVSVVPKTPGQCLWAGTSSQTQHSAGSINGSRPAIAAMPGPGVIAGSFVEARTSSRPQRVTGLLPHLTGRDSRSTPIVL